MEQTASADLGLTLSVVTCNVARANDEVPPSATFVAGIEERLEIAENGHRPLVAERPNATEFSA